MISVMEENAKKYDLLVKVIREDLDLPKEFRFIDMMGDPQEFADWIDQPIKTMQREYNSHREAVAERIAQHKQHILTCKCHLCGVRTGQFD